MKKHLSSLSSRGFRYALVGMLATVLSARASADVNLVVDDDGPADFHTINGALDFAKAVVPESERVVIGVRPGDYVELQIVIDRPNTVLVADSCPQFDAEGFLTSFDTPVTIRPRTPLTGYQHDSIVAIRANGVEIRGFQVDGTGILQHFFTGGIIVTGHDKGQGREGTVLSDIVISENIVRGIDDTAIWVDQADALVERNRLMDTGFVGVFA